MVLSGFDCTTDTVTHKGTSLRQALRHALELDAHAISDNDMCFRKNVVYEITCETCYHW